MKAKNNAVKHFYFAGGPLLIAFACPNKRDLSEHAA